MVYLLGLWEQLVGVSTDSDWPPESALLPRASESTLNLDGLSSREIHDATAAVITTHHGRSLHHIDFEQMQRLRPELILSQEICEVCALSSTDVAAAAGALGYAPKLL